MTKNFDLIAIGTGAAAFTVAYKCRAAGWNVAVVDSRPFGGTCALRDMAPQQEELDTNSWKKNSRSGA